MRSLRLSQLALAVTQGVCRGLRIPSYPMRSFTSAASHDGPEDALVDSEDATCRLQR